MKNMERVRSQYDKLSGWYDQLLAAQSLWSKLVCKIVWGFPDTAYTARLLAYLPDGFAGELLDVPAGTGLFTCGKYLRMPQACVTCLDCSEGMLSAAKERFSAAGIRNAAFRQGDAGALPYADARFDAVLSMNGFHAFPDKDAAFAEFRRVLKPGGLFVGCFYIQGETRRTDWFIRRVYIPGGWFTPPFMTRSELERKLRSLYSQVDLWNVGAIAGFRCVKQKAAAHFSR
ncbi:MAG: class I SAM-dependent methyltransferase [Peptococcaceae bacterium]|jgi:ubiquinone/menaquinone biosynthesis C-methylase UbiE|nr:class I SAM-dependent methyltransferase [Peptococcaceae bacterium]